MKKKPTDERPFEVYDKFEPEKWVCRTWYKETANEMRRLLGASRYKVRTRTRPVGP